MKDILRVMYNDKHSTFHELFKKDCFVSIRTRNLQFLVTEIYKLAKRHLSNNNAINFQVLKYQ